MPPNSSGSPSLLLNASMRRGGPGGPPQPVAGSSAPSAAKQSEFEDFVNAYRPTSLDTNYREPPPPQKPPEEAKLDFRKSIKKLMKRPQGSPSLQNKNHRKEGIQRTPTIISGYSDSERGMGWDAQTLQIEKPKAKRPVSVTIDSSFLPPSPTYSQGPTILIPLESSLLKPDASHPGTPLPSPSASPTSKVPKTPIPQLPPPVPPPIKSPKQSTVQQQQPNPSKAAKSQTSQPPASTSQQPKTPKPSVVQQPQASKSPKTSTVQQGQQPTAVPKAPARQKPNKNGPEDGSLKVPESANALTVTVPYPNPNQARKRESIQGEKRRSGTEGFSDVHCLIITGNNIGRFLPPRHNPDPIMSMKVVPVQDRKYYVIMEFEESPEPPKRVTSSSGMLVFTPDVVRDSREQISFFSWIRESHITPIGMLLRNVEKITEFPYLTYLVVGGGLQEMVQKVRFVGDRPNDRRNQLRFLAGYEEPVTICCPPLTTFPEKPASDKTGFVICLYQVLEYEDSLKFEQNWVMWTGARQLVRTMPDYMGLKRISVHKSIVPTKSTNYVLMCEFSNIMDYLTDACVLIDKLRARCCGFIGLYRVLDSL